jgi:hypothetical protein
VKTLQIGSKKKSLRHFGLAKNLDAQGVTTKKLRTERFRKVRRGYLTGSANG